MKEIQTSWCKMAVFDDSKKCLKTRFIYWTRNSFMPRNALFDVHRMKDF